MGTKNKLDLLTDMRTAVKAVSDMAQIHALRYEIIGYCCDGHWDLADEIFKELNFLAPDLDSVDWDQPLCCVIAGIFLLFQERGTSTYESAKHPPCLACIMPLNSSGRSKISCPSAYTESADKLGEWRYNWAQLLIRRCSQFEKKYDFEVPYIKGQNEIPVYFKNNLEYFQKDTENLVSRDC